MCRGGVAGVSWEVPMSEWVRYRVWEGGTSETCYRRGLRGNRVSDDGFSDLLPGHKVEETTHNTYSRILNPALRHSEVGSRQCDLGVSRLNPGKGSSSRKHLGEAVVGSQDAVTRWTKGRFWAESLPLQ